MKLPSLLRAIWPARRRRRRETAAERSLRLEREDVDRQRRQYEERIADLEHHVKLLHSELKASRDEVDFLGTVVGRQRKQVEAEIAVTARQIVDGRPPTAKKGTAP